jgi:hypothetical protein
VASGVRLDDDVLRRIDDLLDDLVERDPVKTAQMMAVKPAGHEHPHLRPGAEADNHCDSLGRSLFGVVDPTDDQRHAMQTAKSLAHCGPRTGRREQHSGQTRRPRRRARYGSAVIAAAKSAGVILAVLVEASRHGGSTQPRGLPAQRAQYAGSLSHQTSSPDRPVAVAGFGPGINWPGR